MEDGEAVIVGVVNSDTFDAGEVVNLLSTIVPSGENFSRTSDFRFNLTVGCGVLKKSIIVFISFESHLCWMKWRSLYVYVLCVFSLFSLGKKSARPKLMCKWRCLVMVSTSSFKNTTVKPVVYILIACTYIEPEIRITYCTDVTFIYHKT
jgi:hypothetical protein